MADIYDNDKRSWLMSRVKSKDTKPEIMLRKALFKQGIRGYRVNYDTPGSPDIVFPKHKIAIFIDGCFWHGCPHCYKEPKTRAEFWQKKLKENIERDDAVNRKLRRDGWVVMRFWEHEVEKHLTFCVKRIMSLLGKC